MMQTLLNLLSGKARTKAFGSLVCLLLTANAFATDYYVATTGNDSANDGQSVYSSPFLTIQKAADVALPEDVVYVLASTYRVLPWRA
jgi:hypothetical protein